MRSLIWIIVSVILILTIYRQIIEPFLEGYRNRRQPYNEPKIRSKKRRRSLIDKSTAEDADFKDLHD